MPEEQLLTLGARNRVDYLVEQAGYTLGIAARDREELTRYIQPELLDQAAVIYGEILVAIKDRRLMADEAKSATGEQNRIFREAKAWRREASNVAQAAERLGAKLPAGLLVYSGAQTVPAVLSQIEEMTGQLEANKAKIPAPGINDLIAAGRRLVTALRQQDAAQEQKRLRELPAAVKALYLKKGSLYLALKAINNAGRALHSRDPELASKYNLAILHRRGPGEKGKK